MPLPITSCWCHPHGQASLHHLCQLPHHSARSRCWQVKRLRDARLPVTAQLKELQERALAHENAKAAFEASLPPVLADATAASRRWAADSSHNFARADTDCSNYDSHLILMKVGNVDDQLASCSYYDAWNAPGRSSRTLLCLY